MPEEPEDTDDIEELDDFEEIAPPNLFAPQGGWRVRILDLSGGAEDNIVEEVGGFPTLMQANAFARAYVRDSVEVCRAAGGSSARDVLETWFAFGEDALVIDPADPSQAAPESWRSAQELSDFTEQPAEPDERDWRALDPRRDIED